MFVIMPPAPSLRPFVLSYWFVQDLAGLYQGKPIRTAPHPAAVLTFNMGLPNADHTGTAVPHASLLGLQTRVRDWISGPDTYFVMVMLSVRGLITLFPCLGEQSVDNLLDVGSVMGSRESRSVVADLSAAWNREFIATQLNRWLQRRFEAAKPPIEALRFAAACDRLARHGRVEVAAREIGVSERQLHRWSRRQIGIRPKELAQIQRLQASVTSVQTGFGDPVAGFSDQAHQIRSWGRHLGQTPGNYRQTALSRVAVNLGGTVSSKGAITHYL